MNKNWKQWRIIGTDSPISYEPAIIISNENLQFRIWENEEDTGDLINLLNDQERKIERLERLNELKKEEIQARVDVLNKICNKYLNKEVMFKNDVDPNEAVQIVIKEILETHFEV